MAIANIFYRHEGGIIVYTLSVDNNKGEFEGYNLKSSNLNQKGYKTKHLGEKAPLKEVTKLVEKIKETTDNKERLAKIKLAVADLQKTNEDVHKEEKKDTSDKKIKVNYVNKPVLA